MLIRPGISPLTARTVVASNSFHLAMHHHPNERHRAAVSAAPRPRPQVSISVVGQVISLSRCPDAGRGLAVRFDISAPGSGQHRPGQPWATGVSYPRPRPHAIRRRNIRCCLCFGAVADLEPLGSPAKVRVLRPAGRITITSYAGNARRCAAPNAAAGSIGLTMFDRNTSSTCLGRPG